MTTTRSTERGFRGPGEPDLAKLNHELLGATWETRWLEADDDRDEERTRAKRGGEGNA
jgi:hypothetical protein